MNKKGVQSLNDLLSLLPTHTNEMRNLFDFISYTNFYTTRQHHRFPMLQKGMGSISEVGCEFTIFCLIVLFSSCLSKLVPSEVLLLGGGGC